MEKDPSSERIRERHLIFLQKAWEAHVAIVLGYLLNRHRDRTLAEDLASEVFLSMIEKARPHRLVTNPKLKELFVSERPENDKVQAYLIDVAWKRSVDYFRKRSNKERTLGLSIGDDVSEPSEEFRIEKEIRKHSAVYPEFFKLIDEESNNSERYYLLAYEAFQQGIISETAHSSILKEMLIGSEIEQIAVKLGLAKRTVENGVGTIKSAVKAVFEDLSQLAINRGLIEEGLHGPILHDMLLPEVHRKSLDELGVSKPELRKLIFEIWRAVDALLDEQGRRDRYE